MISQHQGSDADRDPEEFRSEPTQQWTDDESPSEEPVEEPASPSASDSAAEGIAKDERQGEDSSAMPMHDLLERLKAGNEDAWGEVVEQLTPYLRRIATFRLKSLALGPETESDLIQSVLKSLFKLIKDEKYKNLSDEPDLRRYVSWKLDLKVKDRIRKAQRRPSVGEAALDGDDPSSGRGIEQIPGRGSASDAAAAFKELIDDAIAALAVTERPLVVEVFLLRFAGHIVPEIAELLNTAERTVERRLKIIRSVLRDLIDE